MTDDEIELKILWRGSRDAVETLPDAELADYAKTLRRALEEVHAHFTYLNATDGRPDVGSQILFDGSLRSIADRTTDAVLRMYRVNRTPFVPVTPGARRGFQNQNAG